MKRQFKQKISTLHAAMWGWRHYDIDWPLKRASWCNLGIVKKIHLRFWHWKKFSIAADAMFFCDFLWRWKDTLIAYSIETTMLEYEFILRLNVCKLVILYLYLSKKRSIILIYKSKGINWEMTIRSLNLTSKKMLRKLQRLYNTNQLLHLSIGVQIDN